jgi:hypothetical protein
MRKVDILNKIYELISFPSEYIHTTRLGWLLQCLEAGHRNGEFFFFYRRFAARDVYKFMNCPPQPLNAEDVIIANNFDLLCTTPECNQKDFSVEHIASPVCYIKQVNLDRLPHVGVNDMFAGVKSKRNVVEQFIFPINRGKPKVLFMIPIQGEILLDFILNLWKQKEIQPVLWLVNGMRPFEGWKFLFKEYRNSSMNVDYVQIMASDTTIPPDYMKRMMDFMKLQKSKKHHVVASYLYTCHGICSTPEVFVPYGNDHACVISYQQIKQIVNYQKSNKLFKALYNTNLFLGGTISFYNCIPSELVGSIDWNLYFDTEMKYIGEQSKEPVQALRAFGDPRSGVDFYGVLISAPVLHNMNIYSPLANPQNGPSYREVMCLLFQILHGNKNKIMNEIKEMWSCLDFNNLMDMISYDAEKFMADLYGWVINNE